jgi:hypothetical protein
MNRLRIIFLSLLVVATVAGGLPITESLAKWSRRSASTQHRRHRRHTRAWWRRHRARVRARRERAEQRRRDGLSDSTDALSDQPRAAAAPAVKSALLSFDVAPAAPAAASSAAPAAVAARSAQLPFGFTPPHTWSPARKSRSGTAVFAVMTPEGRNAGTAVVAPVLLSNAELAGAPLTAKSKTVGGLAVTALRRTVIDRMVAEGGWVTNDFVQEIQGRRVFVVLAQTGAPGAPAQSWAFYFTEIDGRVYSLATNAPVELAAPVAAGSEQFMASLHAASDKNVASQK